MGCVTSSSSSVKYRCHLPDTLDTGDILLIKTQNCVGCCTRMVTMGEWDHVAIILRTAEGFRTVECTGQGIGCWVLEERVEDPLVHTAAIRRLNYRIPVEKIRQLNEYLANVKEHQYKLQCCLWSKLICCENDKFQTDDQQVEAATEIIQNKTQEGASTGDTPTRKTPKDIDLGVPEKKNDNSLKQRNNNNNDSTNNNLNDNDHGKIESTRLKLEEEHEDYFCSSFVAAIYMVLGILPRNPDAALYLPHDFESGRVHALPFLNGAELDQEYYIKVDAGNTDVINGKVGRDGSDAQLKDSDQLTDLNLLGNKQETNINNRTAFNRKVPPRTKPSDEKENENLEEEKQVQVLQPSVQTQGYLSFPEHLDDLDLDPETGTQRKISSRSPSCNDRLRRYKSQQSSAASTPRRVSNLVMYPSNVQTPSFVAPTLSHSPFLVKPPISSCSSSSSSSSSSLSTSTSLTTTITAARRTTPATSKASIPSLVHATSLDRDHGQGAATANDENTITATIHHGNSPRSDKDNGNNWSRTNTPMTISGAPSTIICSSSDDEDSSRLPPKHDNDHHNIRHPQLLHMQKVPAVSLSGSFPLQISKSLIKSLPRGPHRRLSSSSSILPRFKILGSAQTATLKPVRLSSSSSLSSSSPPLDQQIRPKIKTTENIMSSSGSTTLDKAPKFQVPSRF